MVTSFNFGTLITINPATAPSQTIGYLTTFDGQGNVQGSVELTLRLSTYTGDAGTSFTTDTFTAISDPDAGLLEVTLKQSTTYQAQRGNGPWVKFTTGTSATYQLPEVLGQS